MHLDAEQRWDRTWREADLPDDCNERIDNSGATPWAGFFGHNAWAVYMRAELSSAQQEETRGIVQAVLASMLFKAAL